jgi:hypothetical protein
MLTAAPLAPYGAQAGCECRPSQRRAPTAGSPGRRSKVDQVLATGQCRCLSTTPPPGASPASTTRRPPWPTPSVLADLHDAQGGAAARRLDPARPGHHRRAGASSGRNGVPVYVLYKRRASAPVVLSEILSAGRSARRPGHTSDFPDFPERNCMPANQAEHRPPHPERAAAPSPWSACRPSRTAPVSTWRAPCRRQGWRVIPVNPNASRKSWASRPTPACWKPPGTRRIELVNVFRNSHEDVPPVAQEAVAIGAKGLCGCSWAWKMLKQAAQLPSAAGLCGGARPLPEGRARGACRWAPVALTDLPLNRGSFSAIHAHKQFACSYPIDSVF